MARPEYLWRGEPSFKQAFTSRDKYLFAGFAVAFLLGWGLSYIIPNYRVDPLTAFSPYLLMFGGPLWAVALLHSIRTRSLSGYGSLHYIISQHEAAILAIEQQVGAKTPTKKQKIVAKWPLDGSVLPEIIGSHILFAPSNAPSKPELADGFLYLDKPKQVLQILQNQIEANR